MNNGWLSVFRSVSLAFFMANSLEELVKTMTIIHCSVKLVRWERLANKQVPTAKLSLQTYIVLSQVKQLAENAMNLLGCSGQNSIWLRDSKFGTLSGWHAVLPLQYYILPVIVFAMTALLKAIDHPAHGVAATYLMTISLTTENWAVVEH